MKLVGPAPAVPDDAVTVEYLDDILANYTPGGGGGGGSIASAYAGTWDTATAYTAGQIVTWHGSTYLAATTSTNSTPAVGSSAWTLLAGGLHLAGEYDPGTDYSLGDVVTYQGSSYVGLQPVTGSTPADDLYWMPLALGGSGSGTPGTPGTAATVAVGTVTPLAAGATPTVTNAGSSSAAVLNFGIPAGATGTPGTPGTPGTAATVAVGTVTPLAAGATPTVTNAGTSSAAVLNFGIPAGATGSTGSTGAPGAAATVAVGTVSPLAAGATPTVTNAGTSAAAVLNFGIPAGATGSTGTPGTAATVAVGTVSPLAAGATPTVTNAGSSSAAVLNFGIPAGATGSAGTPGTAATVAVGTVTPLAAGATPTVTNAGTSAAAVLNFGIPAGATGSTGSTGSPGTPGAAATVAVGTVTPLAAGATPTVTNAGSSSAAVLNFGIPAGTAGTAATVAVGTVTPLAAGATPTVTNAGSSSAAVLNFGIPAGTAGTPGTAATVAVGTVTPLAAGATPTVTNAGSSSAAVLNFGIPAGASGGGGLTPTAIQTGAYQASAGQLVLANAATAFTVTLPASPAAGAQVGVKKTDTTTNAVTVATFGGATTIDGTSATSMALTAARSGLVLVFDGTSNWRIAASAGPATIGAAFAPSVAIAGGGTGQVLTKTSATDYAVSWQTPSSSGTAATASGAGGIPWTGTGRVFTYPFAATSQITAGYGPYLIPVRIPNACTISSMGFAATGSAGGNIYLALFGDTPGLTSGGPALRLGYGLISAVNPGYNWVSVNITIAAPTTVWLWYHAGFQGATVVGATPGAGTAFSNFLVGAPNYLLASGQTPGGYSYGGYAVANPPPSDLSSTTLTASSAQSILMPLVLFQIA